MSRLHHLYLLPDEVQTCELSDAIDNLADLATSVLHLVNMNFVGNENMDRPSDSTIFWSISSAIETINAMKALVDAYHEQQKSVSLANQGDNHE